MMHTTRQGRRRACRHSRLEPLEPRQFLAATLSATRSLADSDLGNSPYRALDAAGNLYVSGTFRGTIDVDPSAAVVALTSSSEVYDDSYVVSVSPAGDLRWARSFDALSRGLVLAGNSIIVAADFAFDATFRGALNQVVLASPHYGIAAARFDASGELLWATAAQVSLGYSTPYELLAAGPDDFWILGDFNISFDADPGPAVHTLTASANAPDVFAINFNAAGQFQGARAIDNAAGYRTRIGTFTDGSLFVTTATPGASDNILHKIDRQGNLVWSRTFQAIGDPAANSFAIANIATDHSGNLLLQVSARGTVDLDPTAEEHLISNAGSVPYLLKLDATGAFPRAARLTAGMGTLRTDPDDNLYVAGTLSSAADVDLTEGTHTIGQGSALTAYLAKYSPAGILLWEMHTPSVLNALSAPFLQVDPTGKIHYGFHYRQNLALPGTPASIFGDTRSQDFVLATIAQFLAPAGVQLTTPSLTVVAGDSITFTATLSVGAGAASGTVSFYDGDTFLGAATLDGAGSAALSHTPPSHGIHTYTARYSGDSDFAAALSTPLAVVATPRVSRLELSAPQTLVHIGQRIRLSAAFPDGGGVTPTGYVAFYDDGLRIGETSVDGALLFEITVGEGDRLGSHSFTARYLGDHLYDASAFSEPVAVSLAANPLPTGALDRISRGVLFGWAADLQDLDTPLVVQVWIDGVLRSSFKAAGPRNDLLTRFGSGHHGFTHQLPPLAAGPHDVSLITYDPATRKAAVLGTTTITSDSLYFDEAWYLSTYPDVGLAIGIGQVASAWQHFTAAGAREGRNPSAFFNERWYRARYPDIAAAIAAEQIPSGFAHYILSGAREGRDPSPCFNERYYRRAYSDVDTAVGAGVFDSGFAQFLTYGLSEGRSPAPWFDARDYAARYADVDAGLKQGRLRSAVEHFLATGLFEKREPSPWYSESAYLAWNADVAAAVASGQFYSGFSHFLQSGLAEGRRAVANFDAAWYLAQYPDAALAINVGMLKSAFQHYLLYGRLAGHHPAP